MAKGGLRRRIYAAYITSTLNMIVECQKSARSARSLRLSSRLCLRHEGPPITRLPKSVGCRKSVNNKLSSERHSNGQRAPCCSLKLQPSARTWLQKMYHQQEPKNVKSGHLSWQSDRSSFMVVPWLRRRILTHRDTHYQFSTNSMPFHKPCLRPRYPILLFPSCDIHYFRGRYLYPPSFSLVTQWSCLVACRYLYSIIMAENYGHVLA